MAYYIAHYKKKMPYYIAHFKKIVIQSISANNT